MLDVFVLANLRPPSCLPFLAQMPRDFQQRGVDFWTFSLSSADLFLFGPHAVTFFPFFPSCFLLGIFTHMLDRGVSSRYNGTFAFSPRLSRDFS